MTALFHLNVGEKCVCIIILNLNYYLGAKIVHFSNAWIEESIFSPSIPDLILHSEGFKSVEISGGVVR